VICLGLDTGLGPGLVRGLGLGLDLCPCLGLGLSTGLDLGLGDSWTTETTVLGAAAY
jgi:hypothetical protein